MKTKRVDWLTAWDKLIHVWILVFGICSMIAVFLCKEFADVTYIVWMTWIIGIPSATLLGSIAFAFTFLKNLIFGIPEIQDKQTFAKNNLRDIQIAWITGCIATIAALFSHANPFGTSKDFSMTNIGDSLLTLALTYGIYKQKLIPTFLLFLYFALWKMPLWSELQPKSITLAGMIMALIFWRASRAMLLMQNTKYRASQ